MAAIERKIMIRIIKIVLICILMFHVLLANWKINTMEKRLTDRLDSIDFALGNFEKERRTAAQAAIAAQKREGNTAMTSPNKVTPNDLTLPHWPEEKK
jgi:hypothetical protein